MPTKIRFVIRGNFERDKIPIAKIAMTDGIIATSLNTAYGIMDNGPKTNNIDEAPQRTITIIVNRSSGFLL
ncbi:MAG: hypothetical protein YK1312THETA_430004 [Marine Group I thaumarchaeote]|jgi:hypothetical protein|nr:MAG: hypothetical protein YK1312THETA_430004 [Marine Group I thaumarchaeote]